MSLLAQQKGELGGNERERGPLAMYQFAQDDKNFQLQTYNLIKDWVKDIWVAMAGGLPNKNKAIVMS